MNAEPLLISYTLFADKYAAEKIVRADVPWEELVQRIREAPTYPDKAHCPLISLSEYGDGVSDKGSVRFAENVLRVHGGEIDYDAEQVPMSEAAALLQAANIEAALYTTPSHTADKPRWRVFLPFSEAAFPEKRREYLGRANRILGGIAADESFNLSRSFFVGRVDGVEYETAETHGRCIDMAADLEPLYGTAHSGNGVAHDATTDSELRAAFERGDGRYEAMLKLSARWAARGMAADDIEAALLEMLGNGTHNADGVDLRTRVRGLAESAARKFGETRKSLVQEKEFRTELISDQHEAPPLFDPRRARVRANLLDEPPDTVERIAGNLLRRTAGVRASPGGVGKSTLALYEMVHLILGGSLYGHDVMRPGPCVLLTAEDERGIVEYRLWRILEQMSLSRPQREQVIANLYIEDMTGRPTRFVDLDVNGSLVQTFAVSEFISRYSDIKPTLVEIDPMIYFGPGERFVNDGEGELMRAGRRISLELNAAVRFEHHSGKNQSRERQVDQYAGRGGSAGADNARFVHVLAVHDLKDADYTAPRSCTPEDVAKGNVLRLHVAKDSYGARIGGPIWIMRNGFTFTHLVPEPIEDVDPMLEQLHKLYDFIEGEWANGISHTARSLDNRLQEIGLSRQQLRATLHVALERGHLIDQPLPKDQQRGQRKTYLARGIKPPIAPLRRDCAS